MANVPKGSVKAPADYLPNPASVSDLDNTRKDVLAMPSCNYNPVGSQHYAFDLYVSGPTQLYDKLREGGRDRKILTTLQERVADRERPAQSVEWFFLSGGYGLLHALELARTYQAAFYKYPDTPITFKKWKRVLPRLLDEVFQASVVSGVYFFGSKRYAEMVLATELFKSSPGLFHMQVGRASAPMVRNALSARVHQLFGV
jgi:hypothetical protein